MKNTALKIYVTLVCLFFGLVVSAQPGGGPGGPGGPGNPKHPDEASRDNAVLWLFMAGIALGVYILFKQQRQTVK